MVSSTNVTSTPAASQIPVYDVVVCSGSFSKMFFPDGSPFFGYYTRNAFKHGASEITAYSLVPSPTYQCLFVFRLVAGLEWATEEAG